MHAVRVDSRTSPSPSMQSMVDALESMLRSQLEQHEKLLKLLERKRDAVRHARIDVIGEIISEERTLISRITEIDRAREQIVARLTELLQPGATKPIALADLAEHVEGSAQSRLLGVAAQLREVVTQVQQTSSVVRSAAESLSNHINGVMQAFHAALSRAGVYGRQGQIAGGTQMEHSVDVKS